MTAIRKNLLDYNAIIFLFVVAAAVSVYVLSHERLTLPGWVPGGKTFYKVNAEFTTAQAVVPGQGQTVNIAGVPIGNIGNVTLRNGVAVVQMNIQEKYKPIYRDAKLLLRPKTGLKDMYVEMDPGSRSAGAVPNGSTLPVSNTAPDVNLDEILSNLDADTRSYLQILLGAGGETFRNDQASRDLRATFKRFEPTAFSIAKITAQLAQRRQNLRRVVHNFQQLTTALASRDNQLAQFVDSSNANFRAIADEDQKPEETLQLLPGTLSSANKALGKADSLAKVLGPTFQALRPGARALGPSLKATRPFLKQTTPVIQNQLRPFAREAQPTVKQLRPAAKQLNQAGPHLTKTVGFLNTLFNELAYNPPGQEEGYLFWLSWLNHAGANLFSTQDANGPLRRGIFMTDCTSLTVVQALQRANEQLGVILDLLNAPKPATACARTH
jgi:phospholipid/cholesterol/gamma-HCH transport system substrate-binding protein